MSAQAVANYVPTFKSQIDELELSVVDLLRSLPGVTQVEVLVKFDQPVQRIMHLRDWHFVPKDAYAIDMNDAHGRNMSSIGCLFTLDRITTWQRNRLLTVVPQLASDRRRKV